MSSLLSILELLGLSWGDRAIWFSVIGSLNGPEQIAAELFPTPHS